MRLILVSFFVAVTACMYGNSDIFLVPDPLPEAYFASVKIRVQCISASGRMRGACFTVKCPRKLRVASMMRQLVSRESLAFLKGVQPGDVRTQIFKHFSLKNPDFEVKLFPIDKVKQNPEISVAQFSGEISALVEGSH